MLWEFQYLLTNKLLPFVEQDKVFILHTHFIHLLIAGGVIDMFEH